MAVKGASLLPQDFAAGGALPDGDYTIKAAKATTFDYQGKGDTVPSLHVTFADANGTEYEQHYSAGKLEFLAPSEDGKRFINPNGEDAKISKSSNCAQFIASLINSGFPTAGLSDDVTAFGGHKVTITNVAQPRRPGLKDEKEGKTIPVVTKYLGESQRSAAAPRQSAPGAAKRPGTTPASTAASTAASNGDLSEKAISTLQELLAEAPENKLTRLKAGTGSMLRLSKAKDPDMAGVKKLISDSAWLAANAEVGGWTFADDTVALG